ncbi:MAG: class I SAM-dependent methyltransferase [Oscillospiraceae bacterium]|nr:class I SAM-dependent methyltransferase [Oscillospiraceae bacterium]
MTLSPRLAAMARLIPAGSRVADVGTDHGYLPVWLRQTGRCPFVIATDIRPGPLDAARQSAERHGIKSGIDFRLADGLGGVLPQEVDTVVIAGMGGETIGGILARTPWLKTGEYRIILQPQSKSPELMDALALGGYRVSDQHLAEDAGEIYTIYEAAAGDMAPPVGGARYIHPALLERGDALLELYLAGLCGKLRRAIEGLERSRRPEDQDKRSEFQLTLQELEQWRGVHSK